jgi:membrane protein implicated in regulation of membrane protease activity
VGDWITWFWVIAALVLIGSELFHASLTTLFLGAAAVIVALLHGIGLVESFVVTVVLFALTSAGLAIPLRPMVRKYLPGESKYDPSDEDRDAYGSIVQVVETVHEADNSGRIRFQGTTWPATSIEGTILAGSNARLVVREKLAWIVEPAGDGEGSS